MGGSQGWSADKNDSTQTSAGDTQLQGSEVEGSVVSGNYGSNITIESLDDDVVERAFEFAEEFGIEAITSSETINLRVADVSRDLGESAIETGERIATEGLETSSELSQNAFDLSRDYGDSATTLVDNALTTGADIAKTAISKVEQSTRSDLENVTLQTSKYLMIGVGVLAAIWIYRKK